MDRLVLPEVTDPRFGCDDFLVTSSPNSNDTQVVTYAPNSGTRWYALWVRRLVRSFAFGAALFLLGAPLSFYRINAQVKL